MTRIVLISILLMLLLTSASFAQLDTLTIASYNLLFFPSANGAQRLDDFRRIMKFMDPDILVVQEVENQAGALMFLNDVLNAGVTQYEAAPFTTTPDLLNNALFFKRDKIQLLAANDIVVGFPRDVTEYVLMAFGREFSIYSLHLKAGSSSNNQNTRKNQATNLRNTLNALPPNSNFMVCGDFNMRSSGEQAFQILTQMQADNDGRLFDPINQSGNWNNNSFFATIHTQSTRTASFGEGSTGGLDDRFDMILVSNALLGDGDIDILPETYHSFGNDGNHFNMAINAGTNLAVPDSIADALHQASDHLPVVADFVFGFAVSVATPNTGPENFTLQQNYPNPFNPSTTIRFSIAKSAVVSLKVVNLVGQEVATLVEGFQPAGDYELSFDASTLPSGVYLYRLTVAGKTLNRKMLLLK